MLLVWIWSVQPEFVGQLSVRVRPLRLVLIGGGLRFTGLVTVMLPFAARLVIQNIEPVNVGSMTDEKPVTPWLNSWNLSPPTSAGPTFVTVSGPLMAKLVAKISELVAGVLVMF